jgi:hypothetical protein
MKKWMFVLIAAAMFAACGGKGTSETEAPKTDSTTMAADATPKEDAKPVFSADAAAKLITELEACTNAYSCDASKKLIEFGVDAIPQLSAVAVDAAKSEQARKNALYALTEIKTNPGGADLFAAGKTEKEFMVRGDLFKAAALTTDDALLTEMLDYAISKAAIKADHETDMLSALTDASDAKVMTWAKGLAKIGADQELDVANLISDHGRAEDVAFAAEKMKAFKDNMAKSELAKYLVEQGDMSGMDQLLKNMKASDQYDRNYAGGQFADVWEKCPADKKAEALKSLEKIAKENATGYANSDITKAIEGLKK